MEVFNSKKWKLRFLRMAYQSAAWSKDTSTQVGACIVTPDGKPRSFGFNGIPVGIDDDVPERYERPEKYNWFEHAERNAIYLAERSLSGCILFVTHLPCPDCMRGIIQSGITSVVIDKFNGDGLITSDFWDDKAKITFTMMDEAKINVDFIYSDVKLERIGTELFVVPRMEMAINET
jgi:dCMP deaminase